MIESKFSFVQKSTETDVRIHKTTQRINFERSVKNSYFRIIIAVIVLAPSVVSSMPFASSGEHLNEHKEYYVIYLYLIGRKTFKYKRYKAQNILHEN